jgi:hypothetical protein
VFWIWRWLSAPDMRNRSIPKHLPLGRVSLRLSVAAPRRGGPDMPEQTKSMVRRLVEAINAGGEPGAVD